MPILRPRIAPSLAWLGLLGALLLAPMHDARAVQTRQLRDVSMQYRAKELADVIAAVGKATSTRFIYGDDVRGRVSITVPGRVSPEEAIELLNAALFMQGFVAVPIADVAYKVIPVESGMGEARLEKSEPREGGEEMITTLLRLKHADALDVVKTLDPFVSKSGMVIPYQDTNSLIMVSTETRLRRLMMIASALDDIGEEDLMVRQIRYREAERVADLVSEVVNEGVIPSHQIKLFPDARSNLLIAVGKPERLDELREFIESYDHIGHGIGELRVIPIRNREPEDLAEILREMLKGQNDPPPPGLDRTVTLRAASILQRGLMGTEAVIAVDKPTRSLLIQTDQQSFEPLLSLIEILDRVPPRVSVDVVAFEFSRPSNYVFGIDFTTPLNSPKDENDLLVLFSSNTSGLVPGVPDPNSALYSRFTRAPVAFPITEVNGIPIEALGLPTDATSATLNAGVTGARVNLLINPHIVVLSGDEHRLFVGNNIPVPVSATSGQTDDQGGVVSTNVGLSTSQRIERQDVGIELRVTPTVGAKGVVDLELFFELSDIAPSLAGEYAVMGAHTDRQEVLSISGIPYLMDIPFIGTYFRTERRGLRDGDLVLVVSARILKSREEDLAESIRRRINFERAIARVNDLDVRGSAPYAVLLDTVINEDKAHEIAQAFAQDGFNTRVTAWSNDGVPVWDVYVTDLPSMAEAAKLAQRFGDAGWQTQLMILPTENELAGQ